MKSLVVEKLKSVPKHRLATELNRLGFDWEWEEFAVSSDMKEIRGTILFSDMALPFRAPLKFGSPHVRRSKNAA